MSEIKKEQVSMSVAKKRLLERKKELESQLSDLYQVKDAPTDVQDPGDQAQSISQETLQISLQNAEINEYNMIQQALVMIEEGNYGTCIDCGQLISEKRLKLYPNATRCLACQEILEDRQRFE